MSTNYLPDRRRFSLGLCQLSRSSLYRLWSGLARLLRFPLLLRVMRRIRDRYNRHAPFFRLGRLGQMGMMMISETLLARHNNSRFILLLTSTFRLGAGHHLRQLQTAYHLPISRPQFRRPSRRHPRPKRLLTALMHGPRLPPRQHQSHPSAQHHLRDHTPQNSWPIPLLLIRNARRTRRRARLDLA